jgi:hypothetical protein
MTVLAHSQLGITYSNMSNEFKCGSMCVGMRHLSAKNQGLRNVTADRLQWIHRRCRILQNESDFCAANFGHFLVGKSK